MNLICRLGLVVNARAGNISSATELARSAVLRFQRPNEPTGGHLTLAEGARALRITWTSARAFAPAVRWVRASQRRRSFRQLIGASQRHSEAVVLFSMPPSRQGDVPCDSVTAPCEWKWRAPAQSTTYTRKDLCGDVVVGGSLKVGTNAAGLSHLLPLANPTGIRTAIHTRRVTRHFFPAPAHPQESIAAGAGYISPGMLNSAVISGASLHNLRGVPSQSSLALCRPLTAPSLPLNLLQA